jgi:hypothetical protein
MKKALIAALAVVVLTSVSVVAQTEKDSARPGLMKVYEDWKQKEFADKAELREHLVMVVISQRIEEGRAQLDFALINNFGDRKLGNELMLEIQPMVTLRNADGQPGESRAVGVATRALLSADEASENLNSPSTVSVLVPADPQANSVVVKWALSKRTADAKQALSDNTMHLLLEDAPNSALMAITQAKSSEQ